MQSDTRDDLLLEPPGGLTFGLIANVVRLNPERSHHELVNLLADHWSRPALCGGERQRLFSLVRQCLVYEARLVHDVQRQFGSSPNDVTHLRQLVDGLSRRFVPVAHLDALPAIGVIVDYPPCVGELDDVELPEARLEQVDVELPEDPTDSDDVGSPMVPLDLDEDDFYY